MNGDDANKLVYAYMDMELDAANCLAFEKHVSSCKACHQRLDEEKALKSQLQAALPYYQTPDDLKDKILGNLFSDTCNQASDEEHEANINSNLLNVFVFN